jgi:hypothetical protein
VDKESCGRRHYSTQLASASSGADSNGWESSNIQTDLSPEVARAVDKQVGDAGVGSSEEDSVDGIDVTAMRCTLRDVPGQDADLLADTLLTLGAQSARYNTLL